MLVYSSILLISLAPGEIGWNSPAFAQFISWGHIYAGLTWDGQAVIRTGPGDDLITIAPGATINIDIQSSSATQADAQAAGVDAGSGNDTIINQGTITANAGTNLHPGILNPVPEEDEMANAAVKGTAGAMGIWGGDGSDRITNSGRIIVKSEAKASQGEIRMDLPGLTGADAPIFTKATATGIDGGKGMNEIVNEQTIGVEAGATVTGWRGEVNLLDWAKADLSATATATATGIAGEHGITNLGEITATARTEGVAVGVELNLADAASAAAGLTLKSSAVGIQGGNGGTEILNANKVTSQAESKVVDVSVNLSVFDFTLVPDIIGGSGDASTRATAVSAGIRGGEGNDRITNVGELSSKAQSEIHSVGASSSVGGVPSGIFSVFKKAPIADIGITANTSALGITGGKGNDTIQNSGTILVESSALADSTSFSFGFPLFEIIEGKFKSPLPGVDLNVGEAGAGAEAKAIGIRGGDGNDLLRNDGTVTVTASATANANSVKLNIPGLASKDDEDENLSIAVDLLTATTSADSKAVGMKGGGGNDEIRNSGNQTITTNSTAISNAIGVFISDDVDGVGLSTIRTNTSTTAVAAATGLDGGKGNDTLLNEGNLQVKATGSANAFGASVEVQGKIKKGLVAGGAFVEGATATTVGATGMTGGTGNDAITNRAAGALFSQADAQAYSEKFAVTIQGEGKGVELQGAVVLGTTTATATGVGIDGGKGNDSLRNDGSLEAKGNSLVNSLSASVSVEREVKGVGLGFTLANDSAAATAEAQGIIGGEGEDDITNASTATLKSNSNAETFAEKFSVTVQSGGTGVELGGALAFGSTTATGTSLGIDGGRGKDEIRNEGVAEVNAGATANTFSASVGVQGSVKGLGAGVALVDTTTISAATASGISGGDGKDFVVNSSSGRLTVKADSNSYAESFAVTVQGESTGLVLGGALALGSTSATATASGIDGGAGEDEIHNYGMVDVKGDATTNNLAVAVDVQGSVNGVSLGVAFADASSTAMATATGISGGEGDDTIHNRPTGTVKAYAESDSYSEVLSVDVQGKGTGIMIGGAVALAGSTATATAMGIDGGAGKDNLTNEGITDANATSTGNSLAITVKVQGKVDGFGGQAALTDTSTSSTATATGISGGEGIDTVTNGLGATVKSYATAEAYAESVSLSVQGYGSGVTMAGSLARGVTTPTASATGISGGEGDDTLINHGLTDVKAKTDSTSVAVSVRAVGLIEGISVGASLTDTSTTANATAIGIDGGSGNDIIINSGTIQANTDSTLRAASVSFDFGGVPIGVSVGAALASASANATGTAIGINGGEGDDTITNANGAKIDVDSTAKTTSTAVSISANVIGAAWTNTSATTLIEATGIAGGGGKDGIANLGTIDVDSNSTANVGNGSVNLIGATPVSGWTSSTANATGIDGGLGDDWMQNQGTITADAISKTDATGVAIQIAGYSDMDIATKAIASATGIKGGEGVETIYNTSTGSIKATATTYGDTTAVNINLLGYSKTDGSSTGDAMAIGIVGGKEADTIQNDGTIQSTATSTLNASSTPVQLVGYGESNAKGVSNAAVKGIDGGDGVNTLINIGSITGTATANANASSYDIQLSGGGTATAGTESNATATGIAGGKDMETIRNEGTINLTAQSTLVSESRSFKIFGVGLASADSKALAKATGMDGGEGNNTITNASTGSITVSSNASAKATGMTANIGVAAASASTTSTAHSTGIKSGSGEDTITNEGILNVKATSSTYAGSGDLSLVGFSFGDSLTEAVVDGINAGGGNDVITNKGTITVAAVQDNDHPMAYSNVESVSLSLSNFSIGTLGSKAQATGIIGGGGNDTLINTGTITVGDDHWMAEGRAFGFSGQFIDFLSFTSVGATAETVSTGIDGGDGNDAILNDANAVLTVKGSSYAWTKGAAKISTFGSPAAFAGSTTKATATGNSGGNGDDVIESRGKIDVYAHSWADAYTDSWTGWGSPYADSTANATATAVGMDAGGGQNLVTNSGVINVSALAEAMSYAKADSDVDKTESESTSNSQSAALGIRVDDGNNTVNNTAKGVITVTAVARTFDAQGNVATSVSDEEATVNAAPASVAIGIQAGKGNNFIFNDGQMTVTAEVHAKSHASASSTLYTATATATAGGSADATGIKVGDGNNTIKNVGTLTVVATNEGIALSDYPTAHLDNGYAYAGGGNTSLTSGATGISAGNGVNLIENHNRMSVSSTVNADARAYTNTATTTTYAEAYAGGNAKATGILVGNGQNTIKNDGNMTVSATANAYALGNAEEYGSAYIGSESSPGIVAEAVGISTGHGINTITNYGILEVNATATATAEAQGDESTQTVANSYATATGIRTGDGANTVTNLGLMNVTANGLGASAIGISTGANNDRIMIGPQGTLTVRSWATAILGNINALATGIDAGNGNNHVESYGSIQVATEASPLFGDTQLQSFGIKTGSGNDLIINGGRISTENRVFDLSSFSPHWSSSPGVAISSGGGNDTVILMNGSETIGHVDLGDGDDYLTLLGTPLVTGNITGGAGIDTLVFQGAGSVGFTPTDFEQAVKQGAGIFTIANLPTMQRLEVKEGILQINAPYIFSDRGVFQTRINGDGSHGKLRVLSNAELGGNLTVVKGGGVFVNGTKFTLVEADQIDSVKNRFAAEILPSPTPLLSFQTRYVDNAAQPDQVQVEALARSCTLVARNRVETEIAQYLDKVIPMASGDLSQVLGVFQGLSESEFGAAFSNLSPDSYDNFTRSAYGASRQHNQSLIGRMNTVRLYNGAAGQKAEAPGEKSILLAYNDSGATFGPLFASGQPSQMQGKNGLWFNAYGQWGRQKEDPGFVGFDYSLYGFTLGFDHLLGNDLVVGVGVGQSHTDVDLDRNQGDGKIKNTLGSIYASYFTKDFYLDSTLSYGRGKFNNRRQVVIGPIQREATSEHHGDTFAGNLGGGYYFRKGIWALGPYAQVQYIHLDEEGFRESGAESINLQIEGRRTQSLASELGIRVAGACRLKSGSLIPEANLGWNYDFAIDDRVIRASLEGAPGTAFSIQGQDMERNGLILGAGISFVHESGFITSLKYGGEFREDYQANSILGEIRFVF